MTQFTDISLFTGEQKLPSWFDHAALFKKLCLNTMRVPVYEKTWCSWQDAFKVF